MGLQTYGSLARLSHDPMHLVVHDDGSLTDQDVARIEDELPATVLRRHQADERMADLLRRHPKCAGYRRDSVWALKLLDLALLEEGDIAYADSDVLFFRPFSGLFDVPDGANAAFMTTDRMIWSVGVGGAFEGAAVLPRRLNAGLFVMRRSSFDLDFVEWFLGQPKLNARPYVSEQTCWGALARRSGWRMYDPDQINMTSPREDASHLVGVHFTSPRRGLMSKYRDIEQRTRMDPPVRIRTVLPQDARAVDVAWGAARHHVGTTLHRLLRRSPHTVAPHL
jgi:hypothetical protein